jgi:hypothetical protein
MNYFASRRPFQTWIAYTTLNQVESLQIYKGSWKLNLSLLIRRKNKVKGVRKDEKRMRVVGEMGNRFNETAVVKAEFLLK